MRDPEGNVAASEPGGESVVRDSSPGPGNPVSEPLRTCPNCGCALVEQKCKLLCPNRACGYYLSCSDFY